MNSNVFGIDPSSLDLMFDCDVSGYLGGLLRDFRALRNSGDVPAVNNAENTLLHLAILMARSDLAELLALNPKISINQQNNRGYTALMYAARNGSTNVVKKILGAKGAVDLQNEEGHTALILATVDGFVGTMEALLAAGAKRDLQNCKGMTALMYASRNGHIEAARLLLGSGANPNLQNKSGETALELAIKKNHTSIIELINGHNVPAVRPTRNAPDDTPPASAATLVKGPGG
jgi:ankyrin repeat protein